MSSTGNCRGCEGIQVITPQPIFNRAASDQLRYRTGNHPAFFETMLARISEIERQPENPEASTVAARALERLTTRKPDDPSIALLDAWAAVASILSFYQERIANEAFLRTATERRSVEELARLVGYDLRPGLASSVLLAFDVDDQSDEVLFPKGTPVKSTPVPGSNTQPQTFETSEDFIGHPRWNIIRPRLTRPFDLPTSRSQLYFRGTGLRIQPNDLLAVSDKADGKPELISVVSVREINDVLRPTTIVTILTDPIVDNVAAKLSRFLDDTNSKTHLRQSYLDTLGGRFRNHLNAARRSLRVQRLKGADQYFEGSLVREDLLSETNSPDTLSVEIKSMSDWYNEPGKLPSFAFDTTNTTYDRLRNAYISLHTSALSMATAWRSLLDHLLGPISTPTQYATRVADTWKTIDGFAHTDEPKPYVYLGLNRVHTAAVANDPICPAPVASDGLPPTGFTFNRVRINAQATGGISISAGSPVTVAATDGLAEKVREAIAGVKLGGANGAYNFVFLKVFGRKSTGGPEVVVASGIQPIRNLGTTLPPTDFGTLEYDKTVLASGTTPLIDPDFQLGSSSTTTYRMQGTVVVGRAQIRKGNAVWNNAIIQAKDINDEIKKLTLVNAAPVPGRVVVLFTFTPTTAGAKPVAFALRTVIFDHSGSAKQVRSRVGRFLGELSDLSQVTPPDLTDLTNYRTALNDEVINKLQIIAAPAGSSDQREINTLMTDSVSSKFDGIRDELLRTKDLEFRDRQLQPAWTTLRQDSGVDPEDRSKLVAHENALLSDDAVQYIRRQLEERRVLPDALQSVPDYPPLASAKYFDDRLKKIKGRLATQQTGYEALAANVNRLAKDIMELLHARRDKFLKALNDIQAAELPKYGNATGPAAEVKVLIESEFQSSPAPSALAHVAALKSLIDSSSAITANAIKTNDTSVVRLIELFTLQIKNVEAKLSSLNSTQRKVATTIRDSWLDQIALNEGQAASVGNTTTNQQDLLRAIAASAGTLGALTPRDLSVLFSTESNLWAQIQATLRPEDKRRIYDQMRRFRYREGQQPFAYVYRSQSNLYGWNSPGIQKTEIVPAKPATQTTPEIPPTTKTVPNRIDPQLNVGLGEAQEDKGRLFLDGDFRKTTANTFVAIQKAPDELPKNHHVLEVKGFPRTDYGLSGNTTRVIVETENGWWDPKSANGAGDSFSVLRQARVWCDAEQLPFAEVLLEEEPETEVLVLDSNNKLELDEVYPELSTRSRLILEGVRYDQEVGATGEVFEREVIDVVGVEHKLVPNPGENPVYGDRIVTHLTLSRPLANQYWRRTVQIHANVVEATHGQSYEQVLGSGDGRRAFQRFTLNNSPLTRLPTATPRGSADQLAIRVNEVRWDQADQIAATRAQESAYEVGQDREGNPQIQFGDGERGARLPSGAENVRSRYRAGLGTAGNVDAELINQMSQPPLGARSVRNPLRASGGTDEDSLEQARLRAGRATMSLDKLVSLADYRSFALFFAGIDKVEARREAGRIRLIVASTAPEPLLESGALLRNLRKALRDHGDPTVAVLLEPHQPLLLFIAANVAIDPRYEWDVVQAQIRARLLDRFSYRRSEFGQDILAADILSTIQGADGVTYVDLNDLRSLMSISDSIKAAPMPNPRLPVEPNQLCFLDPEVPDMLILEQTS